ncbi:hypothetical protein RchiOBHm_Chr4g0422821 [Rosa chinensis]|uniref:Uncharacterized protein n=1 Tax=Rosa chinensis TaxID=74649 RepID=A0A2P6QYK8_ROSCH|nr:hypothetical protein RchiOBHm_Chr4g0422821 [Rosa chinensis]
MMGAYELLEIVRGKCRWGVYYRCVKESKIIKIQKGWLFLFGFYWRKKKRERIE